jgi:hypothetical protein
MESTKATTTPFPELLKNDYLMENIGLAEMKGLQSCGYYQ